MHSDPMNPARPGAGRGRRLHAALFFLAVATTVALAVLFIAALLSAFSVAAPSAATLPPVLVNGVAAAGTAAAGTPESGTPEAVVRRDITPILDALAELANLLIPIIVFWAGYWLKRKFHIEATGETRRQMEQVMQNAVAYAAQKYRGTTTSAVPRAMIAQDAADYVLQHAPDMARALKADRASLVNAINARIARWTGATDALIEMPAPTEPALPAAARDPDGAATAGALADLQAQINEIRRTAAARSALVRSVDPAAPGEDPAAAAPAMGISPAQPGRLPRPLPAADSPAAQAPGAARTGVPGFRPLRRAPGA